MTTASLTIIIAILIACALAWNAFGGKEDADAVRRRWRSRRRRSPES